MIDGVQYYVLLWDLEPHPWVTGSAFVSFLHYKHVIRTVKVNFQM